jgi:exosortase/archaeosortase family protein
MFLAAAWARILLAAVVVPVTVLKNGIRIVSLCLLSIHVDPSFITGQLHHDGGIVFFLLSLGMLAPVLGLLRWAQRPGMRESMPAPGV